MNRATLSVFCGAASWSRELRDFGEGDRDAWKAVIVDVSADGLCTFTTRRSSARAFDPNDA